MYPYQNNAPYPPPPGGNNNPPYPSYPGQNPQPGVGFGQPSPYPSQPSPYPQAAPYPGAPTSSPGYPPVPGQQQSPYPVQGGGYPPYPQTSGQGYPTSSPYPPPPATSGYPPPPGSYPGSPGYPPPPQQAQQVYPNLGSGIPPPTQYQQSYSQPGVGQQMMASSHTMQQYQETPSIKPVSCDPNHDAGILRKAMKGFGTDEQAIINILAKRTNIQRQQIAQAFKTSYGKDLIKDLKSELGGKLEQVVLALMTPQFDYLAQTIHKAISGLGTKEIALVDILCTATNQEKQWINHSYQKLYKRTIEKDLMGDTSGHFRRLLVSMSAAGRDENPVVNIGQAQADANELYKAGEKKWGTDESAFNRILATRSFPQLRAMLHEYEKITGHSFDKAISKEFSGDIKDAMLAVVKSARNRAGYFAERIHQSIAGFGTKDDDLIFLVVTRSEIDMENIKQEYNKMYGKSLKAGVASDTGGDYKKILLALID